MLFRRTRTNSATPLDLLLHRHEFAYRYHDQDIHFSVWSANASGPIDTIIFLGTVQVGKLPAWIAQSCPQGTAVVQGAPHWLAKADGSDIPEFIHRFTAEAFASVLRTYETKMVRVMADSQAAPGVLRLLSDPVNAAKVDKLALLQPLGLNTKSFGTTPQQRTEVFKKRIAQNLRYQIPSLLSDKRLLHNHRQLLKIIGYDNAKSNAQYSSGLASDATPDLKTIYDMDKQIAIICGQDDKIFPYTELRTTLRENQLNIPILVLPGIPHSPLATKLGLRLIDKAFEYFEDYSVMP